MHEDYLKRGIAALSTTLDCGVSGSDRGWFEGHWPCAVIAAYYFCRSNPLEPGVEELVTREVDRLIDRHAELFALSPTDQLPGIRSPEQIAVALQRSITQHMVSGHNVIYAAYALRVLTDRPDLGTGPVLRGLHQLVGYFGDRNDGIAGRAGPAHAQGLAPEYTSEEHMVDVVFNTLEYAPRLSDRRRVFFDGHAMTHAHALVLLAELGHGELARQGYGAHRVHMDRNRELESRHIMDRWTEKTTVCDHPFTVAFWDRDFDRFGRQWEWGHVFKYLYSFYDLADRISDPHQRLCCEAQLAYLI